MKIFLPNYIIYCLNTIKNNGYEAYCVGGAVRNSLLKLAPDDYDIATSAPANEILNMFEKVIPTGLKHGTVTVIVENKQVEITTYRKETEYSDFRHPNSITFVSNIAEDLKRRDFTVNAMAYNEQNGLVDLFCGIQDLNNKIIRTVGNPNERFLEDALRILRCFRFASTLNFNIEQNTLNSAIKHSFLLKNVSVERIFSELKKTFTAKNVTVLNKILGEEFFIKLFGKQTVIPTVLNDTKNDFCQRFSYFCFYNNIESNNVLSKLKADNFTKNKCDYYLKVLNLKLFDNITNFKQSIAFIQKNDLLNAFKFRKNYLNDTTSLKFAKTVVNNNLPYRIDMLNINGNDIKNCGYSGKEIKMILLKLLNVCINDPTKNTTQNLIETINNF